jgi:hypothetical protein
MIAARHFMVQLAKWLLLVPALPLGCGLAAAEEACPGGVLGVAARVLRIEPAGAELTKRTSLGVDVAVTVGSYICFGEVLQLMQGARAAKSVVLDERGRPFELPALGRFERKSGSFAFAEAAVVYLGRALGGLSNLKQPPDIPPPTAARGGAAVAADTAFSVRPNRLLAGLPHQAITRDLPLILSWRDGREPYTCEAASGVGDRLWGGKVVESSSWCEVPGSVANVARWHARDEGGRAASWSVRYVEWRELPRPEWVLPGDTRPNASEQTAWAWWLWKSAGPEWRMQALAMLHSRVDQDWVAAYLRNQILSESAEFTP